MQGKSLWIRVRFETESVFLQFLRTLEKQGVRYDGVRRHTEHDRSVKFMPPATVQLARQIAKQISGILIVSVQSAG